MLHPSVQEIDRKTRGEGFPDPFAAGTGAEARRRAWDIRRNVYPSPDIAVGSVEERTIAGPDGDIGLRIVRPPEGPATATLVYFHGGAWIVGDLDSHAAHVARIATRANAVVVNVDYRLAPENPFPAGARDAMSALDWASGNIGELGGDRAKLAVGGDSSGGNLAALAAVHARDAGIALACQFLIYPVTDLRARVAAQPSDGDGGVMAKYLGPQFRELAADPRASPACTPSLAGLAPAIIGVGAHDFLYKDNLAYARLLREAGVVVTLREFPNLNHSFFSYTGVSAPCEAAANLLCEDLRTVLHD